MLKKLGCSSDIAANGEEALAAYEKRRYDLILMDCQMPIMDGFEATANIRERESRVAGSLRVPIVAMTANALPGDRNRCMKMGMDDYISKPFSLKTLHIVLQHWFTSQERSSSELAAGEMSPDTPDVDTEKTVDQTVLDGIRALQMDGDPDLVSEVISTFLVETPLILDGLQSALDENDLMTMKRYAHTLKSSSANVGAMPLSKRARSLEADCERESHGINSETISLIMAEYTRTKAALKKELV